MSKSKKSKRDAILDELQALLTRQPKRANDGYMTAREIRRRLGWCESRTANYLRKMFDDGRLEVVRIKYQKMDGQMTDVPAYRIKA